VIKKRASQWLQVNGYSNEGFAEQIREDKIDILVDLSGHNAGTFMQAVTLQPAPVIVKWVGGLISSTGVSAIDYLLSDRVETPEGEDTFYTEKLVRLPNDYICYTPPPYLPAVAPAPVHKNGYITLGCFNNPTKLNPVLLEQWALLLHGIPESRLFLKGREFGSEHLRRRVLDSLAKHAITEDRVIIEGGSPHKELLASYNKVDIALDPWPYSGGLTTCEAMAMGVPVVTLPGPTFAGRHSATHLVNAGMGNLVANNWSEYLFKVMTLANNIDILDNLRTHLRPALLDSPVCDAKLFAHHLGAAFRAIWQRYCEGKAPVALSFTQDDQPIFADETEPMVLQYPPKSEMVEEDEEFSFTFEGRIVTVDHGGLLVGSPEYLELHNTGAFNTICFDPAGRVRKPELLPRDGFLHHYPMACLTDGGPATLYLGQDPDTTGSLRPLPADQQPAGMEQVAEVISEVPLTTTRLRDVQGLDHVDWLVLDNMHDVERIFEGAGELIDSVLLAQIRTSSKDTHHHQMQLGMLTTCLEKYGLKFYDLVEDSPLPTKNFDAEEQDQGERLYSDYLFLKGNTTSASREKQAFILDYHYNKKDLAYQLIKQDNAFKAEIYSTKSKKKEVYNSHLKNIDNREDTIVIHVCFNNIHTSSLVKALTGTVFPEQQHYLFIEKNRSIKGYDVDVSDNKNAFYFTHQSQLQDIVDICNKNEDIIVFMHGLFFDWQRKIISKINNNKIIWSIWGGDLYNNTKIEEKVMKKITHVSTVEQGDYDIFCQKYGFRNHINFRYPPATDFNQIACNDKEKIIFIGNSGDPSNNHIDIINCLSKKQDINNYKLIIPAAYNIPDSYKERIISTLKKHNLFSLTEIQDRFISPEEYLNKLSKAEFLIMAHDRQQGVGTITAAIHSGLKVVLKNTIKNDGKTIKNPVWKALHEENNIGLIAFDEFNNYCRLSDITGKDFKIIEEEKNVIEKLYGKKSSLATLESSIRNLSTSQSSGKDVVILNRITKNNIITLAKEWEETWKQRPFDNSNGLGCHGSFALFYFLRTMSPTPELIFEIGTWRGFSTWVIKQAVPDAKIICSDPILASKHFLNKNMFTPEYRLADVDYTWQDFSNMEFFVNDEMRDKSVVFFDDHQNKLTRIKQAKEKGIKHVIFDDNVPFEYTHKTIENINNKESVISKFHNYEIFPPLFNAKTKNNIDLKGILPEEKSNELQSLSDGRCIYSWVTRIEI
jgi:glycosyltransferase involved in cell wall biosynthesis